MESFQDSLASGGSGRRKIHDRAVRVLKIVWLLLQGDQTVDQLARRFGVSRRTIYRDLALIDEAELPLISQQADRGYRMAPPRRQAPGPAAGSAWT